MRAILDVVILVMEFYWWVIIASSLFSWLVAFDLVNVHNNVIRSIDNTLNQLTAPFLRPLRRILPGAQGIDFSPLVFLLILFFIQRFIFYYAYPFIH
ncbi:MAG: YggT family protein [Alphaproteobacteria bacterium]|nr:YggT family protein [Alphaproteobacteria bacterium]